MRPIDADALETKIQILLCEVQKHGFTPPEQIANLGLLLQYINKAPTIEAKPIVHARNLSEDTPSQFECSVCGCEDWDTYTCDNDVYNYCPNCGAQIHKFESDKNVGSKVEGVKIPVISMEDVPKIMEEMENNA